MITPLGRDLVDTGMESLGAALSLLSEMVSEGKTDEEISGRLRAYACALAQFTRCSTFTDITACPGGKFKRGWRELLDITRDMYQKMRQWHAAGYDHIAFQYGNTSCRPSLTNESSRSNGMVLYVGQWSALDKMVSVYCRGGRIEDPPEV